MFINNIIIKNIYKNILLMNNYYFIKLYLLFYSSENIKNKINKRI